MLLSWTVGSVLESGRITGKASSLPHPETWCSYCRQVEGSRRISADTEMWPNMQMWEENSSVLES